MLKTFYPNEYEQSTYHIDFDELKKRGIKGLLFDIDNTLVPHDAPEDDRAVKLFEKLKNDGFKTCLISNNDEERVKPFAAALGTPYIYKAWKPKKEGYQKAMAQMGTNTTNTVFIGDQLFTDVWGAKRAGVYSILVKPLNPKEEIQIILKRYLERIVLFFYKKSLKKC